MAKRKREMSRTELLFHSDPKEVQRLLGFEFTDKLAWFFHFQEFFTGARQDYMDATLPGLQALQLEQYPLTAAFTDPVALACIKEIHEMNANGLIWECWGIMENMHKGMDVRAKYPKLEQWRAFYCTPQEPRVIGRDMVHILPNDTEETILQRVAEENAQLRKSHEERKKLMDAYYDLMQPLLFQHLPTLDQLEGDHWVLYAVTIRDAYEEWKSLCGEMETTIEYGMPQESITWNHADWYALLSKKMRTQLR
ncbi:MAG: hypothetical protein K9J06_10200 [Flavobacteriales bacterium]|nr:hypothetical protein [Flavobacteriales bacterium]